MIDIRPISQALAASALFTSYRMREDVAVTIDAVVKLIAGADTYGMFNGEDLWGVLTNREGEVHVGVIPGVRGRWLSKALFQRGLALISTRPLTTNVARTNTKGQALVELVGFRKEGETDAGFQYVYP